MEQQLLERKMPIDLATEVQLLADFVRDPQEKRATPATARLAGSILAFGDAFPLWATSNVSCLTEEDLTILHAVLTSRSITLGKRLAPADAHNQFYPCTANISKRLSALAPTMVVLNPLVNWSHLSPLQENYYWLMAPWNCLPLRKRAINALEKNCEESCLGGLPPICRSLMGLPIPESDVDALTDLCRQWGILHMIGWHTTTPNEIRFRQVAMNYVAANNNSFSNCSTITTAPSSAEAQ